MCIRDRSKTIGEKVVAFNKKLKYSGNLPEGFDVLNPFFDNPETLTVMTEFYKKFYNDDVQRKFIIGINPVSYTHLDVYKRQDLLP